MSKSHLACRLLFVLTLLCFVCPEGALATELDEEESLEVTVSEEKQPEEPLSELEDLARKHQPQSEPFELLGQQVGPGQRRELSWPVTSSSIKFNVPVIVAHGKYQGPIVGITAALHGDELNGIEIARQVLSGIDPEKLAGTLVVVPIVNVEGFLKQSRYIADRRDLNRYFPGDPKGVMPARYADGLFQQIVLKCNSLIDLHTGSYYRTNLPQLRADLGNDSVAEMVEQFGNLTVLHSPGNSGMLRVAATAAGVPAVTMEVGGPLALSLEDVSFGVRSVNYFLGALGMIEAPDLLVAEQPVFYRSQWMMAEADGILLTKVKLGEQIVEGQQLAIIVNPMTDAEHVVLAPYAGTVLGKAENQFVSPGYLIFRIGFKKSEQEVRAGAKQKKKAKAAEK